MSYDDLTRATPELPEEEALYLKARRERTLRETGYPVPESAGGANVAVTRKWLRWALSLPRISFPDAADPTDGSQPFVLDATGLGLAGL